MEECNRLTQHLQETMRAKDSPKCLNNLCRDNNELTEQLKGLRNELAEMAQKHVGLRNEVKELRALLEAAGNTARSREETLRSESAQLTHSLKSVELQLERAEKELKSKAKAVPKPRVKENSAQSKGSTIQEESTEQRSPHTLETAFPSTPKGALSTGDSAKKSTKEPVPILYESDSSPEEEYNGYFESSSDSSKSSSIST